MTTPNPAPPAAPPAVHPDRPAVDARALTATIDSFVELVGALARRHSHTASAVEALLAEESARRVRCEALLRDANNLSSRVAASVREGAEQVDVVYGARAELHGDETARGSARLRLDLAMQRVQTLANHMAAADAGLSALIDDMAALRAGMG